MKRTTAWVAALAAASWLMPAAAGAQQAGNPNDPWCRDGGGSDRANYCEVREMTMARPSVLAVDAAPNGGIKIVGTNRGDVFVRARVSAYADTDQEAHGLVRQVAVQAGSTISSQGPARSGENGWSVSYEVSVPVDQALTLTTVNGGIAIENVKAEAEFTTRNGGISLTAVGGRFKGRTNNGGVHVVLEGQRWDGEGLDVRTQNGGISLQVPEGFAAHVEASTVNGGVRTNLPVSAVGELTRRQLVGDLNGGGPTLKMATTNGGVAIQRRD